jgi:hypothetical protein
MPDDFDLDDILARFEDGEDIEVILNGVPEAHRPAAK